MVKINSEIMEPFYYYIGFSIALASATLIYNSIRLIKKGIALRKSNEVIVSMPKDLYDVFTIGLKHKFPNGAITYGAFSGLSQKAKDMGYVSVGINGKTYHIKIEN